MLLKGTTEKVINYKGFLYSFLGTLMKVRLPLKKNVPKSLVKTFWYYYD